jgi:polar amino acid transport system permease protein
MSSTPPAVVDSDAPTGPPVIVRRPHLRPGWRTFALAAIVGLLFYEIAGSTGALGKLLFSLSGEAGEGPAGAGFRLVVATLAAAAALAVAAAARLLPFWPQTVIVWAALFAGFLAFAFNFDLKYSLIGEKFPFLAGLRLSPEGFVQGAAMTLFITAISAPMAAGLALLAALGRLSKNPVAFGSSTFYTSFFRGTPLLIQVYLIYLGLPQVGLVLTAIPAGFLALSLNYGAYIAEIVRAGIEAVPGGQWEAATALGLKRRLIMQKVIMPQAMRVIVPPTFSQFIAMLKDSSLVSLMGVWELTFLARAYGRADFRYVEMLLTAAMLYWLMSIVLELLQARIERYYGKGFVRDAGRTPAAALPATVSGHH